jgi:hypothetical protein
LDFEKTQLLYGLWSVDAQALRDDLDSQRQVLLNSVSISTAWSTSWFDIVLLVDPANVVLDSKQVSLGSHCSQKCDSELHALSFNLPVLLLAQIKDLWSDLKNTLCIKPCNSIQDIERIHSDVHPTRRQPN